MKLGLDLFESEVWNELACVRFNSNSACFGELLLPLPPLVLRLLVVVVVVAAAVVAALVSWPKRGV